MNLKDKLKHLPTVYYINLDNRIDRKEYMEEQFDKWGIRDYIRYSASDYMVGNYKSWESKVILNPNKKLYYGRHLIEAATALTYLDLIKKWLSTTNEKYFIIMEDDYDLSMIEYWHFDWEYLMNNIPYDWDAIQLGFENRVCIPCFLHPTYEKSGTGALLLTRSYAEKIVRIHLSDDGKYNLNQKISSYTWTKGYRCPSIMADYMVSKNGRCYSLPLIYMKPDIGSYETNYLRSHHPFLQHIKELYHLWWKELRDNYTLEEFFTYGKPNDFFLKCDEKYV